MIVHLFGAYWAAILTTAMIMAIAAIGLQITMLSGQFSVMHAALMGLGAYAGGYAALRYNWPLVPTLILGFVVAALVSIGTAALFSRLSGLLMGIATLSIGQLLSIAAYTFFPGRAQGYFGVPLRVSPNIAFISLAIVLIIAYLSRRTHGMMTVIAVGGDTVASRSVGIGIIPVRIWAFAVGGGLAGLAGALSVQNIGLIEPTQLGFVYEIPLLTFVIVGGVTTFWGALIGTFAITIGEELLRISDLDRYWILGILLAVAMILRPEGFLIRRPTRLRGWSELKMDGRGGRLVRKFAPAARRRPEESGRD